MAPSRQQIKQSPSLQFASHKPYGKKLHLQAYHKYQQAPRPQPAAPQKVSNMPKPHRRQKKANAAALHVMYKLPNATAAEQHLPLPQGQHQQAFKSSPVPALDALPVPPAAEQAPSSESEMATTATTTTPVAASALSHDLSVEGCMLLSIAACLGNKDAEALVTLQGGYNPGSVESYRTHCNSQELNNQERFTGWPAAVFEWEALGYGVATNKQPEGLCGEHAAAAAAAVDVQTTTMPALSAAAAAANRNTAQLVLNYTAAIKNGLHSAWNKVEQQFWAINCFGSSRMVKGKEYCGEGFGGLRTSDGDLGLTVSVTLTSSTTTTTAASRSTSSSRPWLQKLSFFVSKKDVTLVGDDQ